MKFLLAMHGQFMVHVRFVLAFLCASTKCEVVRSVRCAGGGRGGGVEPARAPRALRKFPPFLSSRHIFKQRNSAGFRMWIPT